MKRSSWFIISISLILLQMLIDGLLNISVFCCLFPIMFIILTLPYRYKTVLVTLTGFTVGIIADLLGNGVPGLNAAAATAVAFFRIVLLHAIAGKFIMDKVERPDLFSLGYIKIILYSALCSLIYLTIYVLIENGGFSNFLISLGRIFVSVISNTALMTLLFTLCGQRRKL